MPNTPGQGLAPTLQLATKTIRQAFISGRGAASEIEITRGQGRERAYRIMDAFAAFKWDVYVSRRPKMPEGEVRKYILPESESKRVRAPLHEDDENVVGRKSVSWQRELVVLQNVQDVPACLRKAAINATNDFKDRYIAVRRGILVASDGSKNCRMYPFYETNKMRTFSKKGSPHLVFLDHKTKRRELSCSDSVRSKTRSPSRKAETLQKKHFASPYDIEKFPDIVYIVPTTTKTAYLSYRRTLLTSKPAPGTCR